MILRSTSTRAFPLVLFSILCLSLVSGYNRPVPNVATFSIPAGTNEPVIVNATLNHGGSKVECHFKYTTTLPRTPDVEKGSDIEDPAKALTILQDVVKSATNDPCLEMSTKRGVYEVCMGRSVSLKPLGGSTKSATVEGKYQATTLKNGHPSVLFTDGDACKQLPSQRPRRTWVMYACGGAPGQPEIETLEESDLCELTIVIRDQRVCSNAMFNLVPTASRADDEQWFMEVVAGTDAHWVCAAYPIHAMQDLATGVRFSSWSMWMTHDGVPLEVNAWTARLPNRRPVPESSVSTKQDNHLRSSSAVSAQIPMMLEYIKIIN